MDAANETMPAVWSAEDVAALYQAAPDADRWCEALHRLGGRLASRGMALLISHAQPGDAPVCASSGVPASEIEAQKQLLCNGTSPSFGLRGALQLRPHHNLALFGPTAPATAGTSGTAVSGRHLVARLDVPGGTVCYADVYREAGDEPFDAATIDALAMLTPHLDQALAIARRFADLSAQLDALRSMLDILPSSRFLLGPQGAVTVMNAAGKAMLEARDGLLLDGGRLCAARASDRAGLQRAIDAALAGETDAAREPLMLRRNSGQRPYAVFVAPPDARAPAFASAGKLAALTVVDLDRALAISPTVFRAEFGLSRTESLLAARLVAGENLVEAATAMKINVSTVRLHLERVFLKTGVHRQGELISLLLGPFVDLPAA